MSVIKKIRDNYGKLAGGLIALSLVAFVLTGSAESEIGKSIRALFTGGNYMVKVNGEKLENKDFQLRTKEYETVYSIFYNGKLDETKKEQMKNEAVQNMVFEVVMNNICDKLGIIVSKDEEKDLIYGNNPAEMVRRFPYFKDQNTGEFNPAAIKAVEKATDKEDPEAKARTAWENVKSYIRRNITMSKMNLLIAKSFYNPRFLLDKTVSEQSDKASILYVKVPYTSVPDADAPVTQADINEFIKNNEKRFTIPEGFRSMQYVSFDIIPSHDDSAKVMENITKAKEELATAPEKEIENVVNRNSDNRYYEAYANKRSFLSRYADTIMKQPVGTVYGPYFEGTSYNIVKILEKKDLPDTVKYRHIWVVIKYQGQEVKTDSAAKKTLDSALTAIAAGGDFKTVAAKYSDDPSAKSQAAGEYTVDITQKGAITSEYDKAFADFIYEGKAGEKKVLKDSNDKFIAYDYVEIEEQKGIQPTTKLAMISKELAPGDATQNTAFSKATEFAGKNTTGKDFDMAVAKEGLNKLSAEGVKPYDFTLQAFGSCREVVRWIYAANIGDVSGVFTLENRYVVGKLATIQNAGIMEISDAIRPRIEMMVRNEKKAKKIAAKYKGASSLDMIAQSEKQTIQHADSFSLGSSYIQTLGFEPAVQGYTFFKGLAPNTVSPGISGSNDGVFFITVANKWSLPMDDINKNMLINQQRMQSEKEMQNIDQMVRASLIKDAHVKYNAKNF